MGYRVMTNNQKGLDFKLKFMVNLDYLFRSSYMPGKPENTGYTDI